jgi:two-component system, sporulation sensor kinase E
MNIYEDRSKYKIIIVLVALLIGSGSVYYTNYIVYRLAQREREQIQLYAKGLQYLVSQDEDESITFFFQEVIRANEIFPVIWVSSDGNVLSYRNIPMPPDVMDLDNDHPRKRDILQAEIAVMKGEHPPVVINLGSEVQYVYYSNSILLSQLQYYPYIQLTVIAAFAFMAYLVFNYSRRAEQNQVWVGLAKETAHQLGTPLSSLMAWIEYFKSDPKFADDQVIPELEKDVERLEMITARFSNIGSVPTLKYEDLYLVVQSVVNYLQKRISTKVKITIHPPETDLPPVRINRNLFEWVIENICKNAVDAMSGAGAIDISLKPSGSSNHKIAIDIADTGRGIAKANLKRVFDPGFSTKKRGWGLGLTLAKRIMENYHGGKVFVKQSEPNKGTTFRILLNTDPEIG